MAHSLTDSLETPLVSVIVPSFNAERTIIETIQSVLVQTETRLEIIVSDDASTDQTPEIVGKLVDPRVRLIRSTTNLGPGIARDTAIASAKGRWIALLDADDCWHPDRLETLLRAAGEDTSVMVFDDILTCHWTKNGLHPWRRMHGLNAFGLQGSNYVDVPPARWANARQFLIKPLIPSAMLRSSGIRHSDLPFSEDTEFFLRLIAAGMRLRYVPVAYYYYRVTPGSLSATPARAHLMRDMLAQMLPLFANDPDMIRVLKRKISYRDFTIAIKSRNISIALRLALRNPSLVANLIERCIGEIPYLLHRLLHRGSKRGEIKPST